MATVAEVVQELDTSITFIGLTSGKMDQVKTKIENLSTGSGATQGELDSIAGRVSALSQLIIEVDTKVNEALAI